MGDRWVDCERIFAQDDDMPVHPDSITGWFHDFISQTDLPQISIHSLASHEYHAAARGGDPVEDGELQGRARTDIDTANIYSHAIRTADEKAVEVLENMMNER